MIKSVSCVDYHWPGKGCSFQSVVREIEPGLFWYLHVSSQALLPLSYTLHVYMYSNPGSNGLLDAKCPLDLESFYM